jgi:cation transporter-like permease
LRIQGAGTQAAAYAGGITATVRRGQMRALVVAILVVAVVLFIVGLAVRTLGFLLGVAPVLVVVALVLLLLNRFRGRRIPR